MTQVTIIGSQEHKKRYLTEQEKEPSLDMLLQLTGVHNDTYHAGIIGSQEIYNPYGLDNTYQPHRNVYQSFINLASGLVSLTLWQVMHVETSIAKETPWHGVYLYRVTHRSEDIYGLDIYRLKQIAPGDFSYVTFYDLNSPTVKDYKGVTLTQETIPAPAYEYRQARDAALDGAMARMDKKRIAEVEAAYHAGKPYQCASCSQFLAFPETLFYHGTAYCQEHLPAYDKHQQW